MKSMKLSEYFNIVKPQYTYLQLIPHNSIRNYNSDKIAHVISSLYKNIIHCVKIQQGKFFFQVPSKVSYYIYMEKGNVNYYFIVPTLHINMIREKIGDTWKRITIKQVDKVPSFQSNAMKYQVSYKKEDALSLSVDKRTNTLLSSTLNVIEVMEEGDRLGLIYNFIPTAQNGWRAEYNRTIQKIQDNYPIDRDKGSISYLLKLFGAFLLELVDIVVEVITNKDKPQKNAIETLLNINMRKEVSAATKSKREATVLNTQIMVVSESKDKSRAINNAVSVCEAHRAINEDNEMIYSRVTAKVDISQLKLAGVPTIKTSVSECQNFIALPGREILESNHNIHKIDTLETEVPEELQQGTMGIGENVCKGNTQSAYLSNDREYKNLTLAIIGPTRAGKTTLIANLSKNAVDHGECTILFDFCGNCDLSREVSEVFPSSQVLTIDCSNSGTMQGLGYNEITPMNDSVFEVYRCAKTKTTQLMTLINTLSDSEDLRARMERYLEAAAVLVFVQSGSIKDVFGVLQDHNLRHRYIKSSPSEQSENLEEYITSLEELDEKSKPTKDNPVVEVVGTKISNVQGILNRVNKLKQNTYMELMLKKDCSNNINLVEEMQKPQLICIRMPEIMFSTESEKDVYCTYWLTKIWGALQKRKWDVPKDEDRVKVNIVFDELYQVPSCQEFLRSKLSQIAKFTCKPIISCHYLGQISIIRNELKAANSSYMVLQGADKDNFRELKDELQPYELDDLLNLKRYHSLNLVRYEKGYAKFITALPKPI